MQKTPVGEMGVQVRPEQHGGAGVGAAHRAQDAAPHCAGRAADLVHTGGGASITSVVSQAAQHP